MGERRLGPELLLIEKRDPFGFLPQALRHLRQVARHQLHVENIVARRHRRVAAPAQGDAPLAGRDQLPVGLEQREHLGLLDDPAAVAEDLLQNVHLAAQRRGDGPLELDFRAIAYNDESDYRDGVFLSQDGSRWYPVVDDWSTIGSSWQQVHSVDLSGTPVDTNGTFYLLFGQEDNYPIFTLDGIGIDDILVRPAAPELEVTGLIAGGVAAGHGQGALDDNRGAGSLGLGLEPDDVRAVRQHPAVDDAAEVRGG